MDADTLFREGVAAIRDHKDNSRGRQLLIQSLKINPHNDMAWLWLTHTVTDPAQRLELAERALQINPTNEHALALRDRLLTQRPPSAPQRGGVIRPLREKTIAQPITMAEAEQIVSLLNQAESHLATGNIEAAVECWIQVLNIQVDHEIAIRNAVVNLWRLGYRDDAKELIWRALKSGSTLPFIYLTAIDLAEREHDYDQAEALRARVAVMPGSDEMLILTIANQYANNYKLDQAVQYLRRALQTHPNSQKIMLRIGELYQEMGHTRDATYYLEQAVQLGAGTKEGREADKKLVAFVPTLTDRERGSVWLAMRETLGIVLFYLFLGWQDAGLNLFLMGPRWLGVLLSFIGGYFLITATSSPQQVPIASWFGGSVPDEPQRLNEDDQVISEATALPILPEAVRYFLGFVGTVLLIVAFVLVFERAISLLSHYSPPGIPSY